MHTIQDWCEGDRISRAGLRVLIPSGNVTVYRDILKRSRFEQEEKQIEHLEREYEKARQARREAGGMMKRE